MLAKIKKMSGSGENMLGFRVTSTLAAGSVAHFLDRGRDIKLKSVLSILTRDM